MNCLERKQRNFVKQVESMELQPEDQEELEDLMWSLPGTERKCRAVLM